MKLLEWIDINKLNWLELSKNENAIELLKANPDKINWLKLSLNPNAIDLIREELLKGGEKINWNALSTNPNAISLLKENPNKLIGQHYL